MMETPDATETGDKRTEGARSNQTDQKKSHSDPGAAANPPPLSAIERQQMLMAARGRSEPGQKEKVNSPPTAPPQEPRHTGFRSVLALPLLLVVGLAILFATLNSPPHETVSNVPSSHVDETPELIAAPAQGKIARTALTDKSTENSAPTTATPPPENVEKIAAVPEVLSVPLAELTLHGQSELFTQLVRTNRAKLANNVNDPAATAALIQLRERSLAEFGSTLDANDYSAAKQLAKTIVQVFPEFATDKHYRSLVTRMNQLRATPQIAAATSPSVAAVPASPAEKDFVSSKPQIRAVSITPGDMTGDHFAPVRDGRAFMVKISYRNFFSDAGAPAEDQTTGALTVRIGIPGNSEVLAEVQTPISGDRGTTSFLMEPLSPGTSEDRYRLDFIYQDKVVASRIVRPSLPGY